MGQNPVAIAAAIVTTLLSFSAHVAAMIVVCREAKEVANQCDIAAWGAWVRAVEFILLTVGLFIASTAASIVIEEAGAPSPVKLAVDGAVFVVDCAVATLAFWISFIEMQLQGFIASPSMLPRRAYQTVWNSGLSMRRGRYWQHWY